MSDLIKCHHCMKIHDRHEDCDAKLKHKAKTSRERKNSLSDENKKYERFYSSKEWIRTRDEMLKENNYMCEVCMELNIYNYSDIQVHHIEKLRNNWNRRLDKDNLICVCRMHHRIIEGMDELQLLNYVMAEKNKAE